MTAALRFRHLWPTLGALMILAVIVGSLAAVPMPVQQAGMDKVQHVLAYGVLMYWWGMLQPGQRLRWAVALVALGMALEAVQATTGYRQMEWRDAIANLLGVLLALAILRSGAAGLLAWLDRNLGDRLDTRGA